MWWGARDTFLYQAAIFCLPRHNMCSYPDVPTERLTIVAPSPIHGQGLFARHTLRRGTCIGEFHGESFTRRQVFDEHSTVDRTYLVSIKQGTRYIDSRGSLLGYMNHADGVTGIEQLKPNVRCVELKDGSVRAYVTRDVNGYEELVWNYGYVPPITKSV